MTPYKLSAVHHVLEELGAAWTEIDGWRTPAHFGSPEKEAPSLSSAVGLCDLSFQRKVEFRGRELSRVFPGLPELGRITGGYLCRITHDQALWIGSPPVPETQGCIHMTDRTSGFAQLLLAGPKAPEVLSRLTSLDLRDRDLSCRCAPLAHINAILLRRDRQQVRAYEILVTREYGEYTWKAVWDAGTPFGITAFGLEARSVLEEVK